MKNVIIFLIALSLILTGCRYKEGPLISFRSAEKRLVGFWSVESIEIDGIDSVKYYYDSCGAIMRIWKPYEDNKTYYSIEFINGRNTLKGQFHYSGDARLGFSFEKNETPVWCTAPLVDGKGGVWTILKSTYNVLKIKVYIREKRYNIKFKRIA